MSKESTVTIPLKEYQELIEAFRALEKHKQQDENQIIIRDGFGYWYCLTKDDFIKKIAISMNAHAERINDLTKELQERKLVQVKPWRIF